MDGDRVPGVLAYGRTEVGPDGELVRAIAEGHERALEGVAVDDPADSDPAAGAEELSEGRHLHVRVRPLVVASLEDCLELLVQGLHRMLLVTGVGVVMVAAGLLADIDGERRVGTLVVLAGISWLLERLLSAVDDQLVVALAGLVASSWVGFLCHAVLAFPGGRLTLALARLAAVALYVANTGFQVVVMLTIPSFELRGGTGSNPLHVVGDASVANGIIEVTDVITVAVLVGFVAVIVHRAATATTAARRAHGFVWVGATLLGVNLTVIVVSGLGVVTFNDAYGLWLEIVAGAVPLAMAASLVTARLAEDRLVALVGDLEAAGPGVTLRNALRRALADPSLEIVYLRAGGDGSVGELGVPGQAYTPVVRGERPIAALVHDPALLRSPERLHAAIGATALAIANEQFKAELRAQLIDVQASRAESWKRRIGSVGGWSATCTTERSSVSWAWR